MKAWNNISALFSGLGAGNANSINFGDYASIKNGSYGKLMKSYYAQQKGTAKHPSKADASDTAKPSKKKQVEDTTGLSQMKKEADGLKTAAEALQKEDLWKTSGGAYDMDKIAKAVNDFAKEYNNTLDQAGKVNSKDISQSVRFMNSMAGTMSKALSKVGITVETDGKLTVDEDALKKANGGSLKTLFSGAASFGGQAADKASEIARAAIMNSSVYSGNGTLKSSLPGMFNNWI